MVSHRCKNCLWFDRQHKSIRKEGSGFRNISVEGDYIYGYCRKHKPISLKGKGFFYGTWPVVDEEDLCGEFREEKK